MIGILIILLLILINGFFVAAEFSLVSIRPSRIDEMIKDNKPAAMITKRAVLELDNMLSVCQVGITIASLLLGWVGEMYLANLFESLFNFLGYSYSGLAVHSLAVGIAFSLITFLHIMLGELVPKSLAIQNTETIALAVSIPMFAFHYLFFPLTFFMNKMTSSIVKAFRMERNINKYVHSPEELMIIIENQTKDGNIDETEMSLIQKTFNFSEHTAKDVMTHRLSVVGIKKDDPIDKILPIIAEHHFSRYPVYEESMDQIVGIVHVQNFMNWLASSPKNKKQKISSLMQTPVFVPESMTIQKVLQKLRSHSQHMAIVVDEYGGVSGILTLEDIIEEIFGEIRDETDESERGIASDKRNRYLVIDGETEIDELAEILAQVPEDELHDVRTIAGFFLERHEDMPTEGSVIKIPRGELKVKKMEGNKIVSLQFHLSPEAKEKDKEREKEKEKEKEKSESHAT